MHAENRKLAQQTKGIIDAKGSSDAKSSFYEHLKMNTPEMERYANMLGKQN